VVVLAQVCARRRRAWALQIGVRGSVAVRRPAIPVTFCDGHEVFFLGASGQIRMTVNNLVTPRRESCDQVLHCLQGGHGPPRSGRVLPIRISDLLTFSYQSLAKSY
jgi:hypothetical protein